MRITICEDMDFYLAPIQKAIQHWMSVSGHTDVIVTVFKSSEDLLQQNLKKTFFFLIFK